MKNKIIPILLRVFIGIRIAEWIIRFMAVGYEWGELIVHTYEGFVFVVICLAILKLLKSQENQE